MSVNVGLLRVYNSGLVGLRYDGETRSDRDALWTMAKLRKPSRCEVLDSPLLVGSQAFRSVGNQDYRGRRISRDVIWLMLVQAVETDRLEPDFSGWSDIAEWFEQTGVGFRF